MARRKKDPPPLKSVAWESYKPDDDLYWRLGGPFVPLDRIEPNGYAYSRMGEHMKPPARLRYLGELIDAAVKDLERSKAYYTLPRNFMRPLGHRHMGRHRWT